MIEEIPIRNLSPQVETYNGKQYNTAILTRCIICPQKSGKLTINSGKYDLTATKHEKVSFGSGFAYSRVPIREKLSISSNSASVNIIPLPTPQPDNFSGAVGQFSIDTKLTPNTLRTNETALLQYTISGTGNVKYIKEPTIDFPAEFELYTPKNESKIDVSNGTMSGTTIFEYTFVPQSVGKFQIPSHEFVYFDPVQKKYITLNTKPYIFNVAKGASVNQQDVKIKNTDIHHIKLGDKNLCSSPTFIIYSFWYWATYILLIIAFAVFVMLYKKHLKLSADIVGLRLAKASKVAKKRLKLANKYMSAHKDKQFYEEIVNAMWGYLSDKLSIPVSQLLRDNVATELINYGADNSLTKEVIEILDQCDMALYAPLLSGNQMTEIYNKTIGIINKIESIKRTKSDNK